MEPIDLALARLLAVEAVCKALIAMHPRHGDLLKAIRAAAVGLSATSMHGQQADGATSAFDQALARFLATAPLERQPPVS